MDTQLAHEMDCPVVKMTRRNIWFKTKTSKSCSDSSLVHIRWGKCKNTSLQDPFITLLLPLSIKVVLGLPLELIFGLVWMVYLVALTTSKLYTSSVWESTTQSRVKDETSLDPGGWRAKTKSPFCLVRIELYPPGTGSAPECITCWEKGRDLWLGVISILTILHTSGWQMISPSSFK